MKLDKNLFLENDNLILKPLCSTVDLISDQSVVAIANDYDIAKYVGHAYPYPYTVESSKSFKEYSLMSWDKGSEYVFAIFEKKTNDYIGNIGIKINEIDEIVDNLGYWIGTKYSGKGYMTQAVSLMCDYCFNTLNLRKIEAAVYETNIASQKVLEKNNFVIEGVKKKNYKLKNGEILDQIIYGRFK